MAFFHGIGGYPPPLCRLYQTATTITTTSPTITTAAATIRALKTYAVWVNLAVTLLPFFQVKLFIKPA